MLTFLQSSCGGVTKHPDSMVRDGPRPKQDLPDAKVPDGVRDGPLDADLKKTDIALPDQGMDLGSDTPVPDLQLPDKLILKDMPVPDQSLDLGAVLAMGTFSTGGSGAGGNIVLAKGGFESGEQLCSKTKTSAS